MALPEQYGEHRLGNKSRTTIYHPAVPFLAEGKQSPAIYGKSLTALAHKLFYLNICYIFDESLSRSEVTALRTRTGEELSSKISPL